MRRFTGAARQPIGAYLGNPPDALRMFSPTAMLKFAESNVVGRH
jgi:hypothetical protein